MFQYQQQLIRSGQMEATLQILILISGLRLLSQPRLPVLLLLFTFVALQPASAQQCQQNCLILNYYNCKLCYDGCPNQTLTSCRIKTCQSYYVQRGTRRCGRFDYGNNTAQPTCISKCCGGIGVGQTELTYDLGSQCGAENDRLSKIAQESAKETVDSVMGRFTGIIVGIIVGIVLFASSIYLYFWWKRNR